MKKTFMGIALGVLWGATCLQAELSNSITIREPWSNVFGGKEAVFHVAVTGPNTYVGQLGWQLAAEGRTLARGESAITVSPVNPREAEIRVPVPEVKAGVVMQARLSLMVMYEGKEAGSMEKTLWVFPEDPFADRGVWLKSLHLKLFDPVGKTSALFDRLGIPYASIRTADSLADVKEGVVMVGEGISFKEYRGLAGSMLKAAAGGVSVICLAPAAGEFAVPSANDGNLPVPETMEFLRAGVIRKLDKRLDAAGWAPDGRVMGSGLALKGERGPVLMEVGNNINDWPWVELGYARNHARCVVCGFGIVEKWADSPTPRNLLVKILELVSAKKGSE